jgi:hypothetical protein
MLKSVLQEFLLSPKDGPAQGVDASIALHGETFTTFKAKPTPRKNKELPSSLSGLVLEL